MSKSRVKSDQEYQNILGFSFDNEREEKDSNVSGYFDNLRENENVAIDVNPFDRIVSIGDIKDSLKSDLDATNVLDIKAEIAHAQSNHNDLEEGEESRRSEKKTSKEVTGENTRKLYDNLRYSHLNRVDPQAQSTKKEVLKYQQENKVTELDEGIDKRVELQPEVEDANIIPLEVKEHESEHTELSIEQNPSQVETYFDNVQLNETLIAEELSIDSNQLINEEPTIQEVGSQIIAADAIELSEADISEPEVAKIIQPEKLEQELNAVDESLSLDALADNTKLNDTRAFDSKKLETLAQALDSNKEVVEETTKEKKKEPTNAKKIRDYAIIIALLIAIGVVAFLLFQQLTAN